MSGLWPLAWRALRARPLRSGLTLVAVSLGIAAVLGVLITVDALDAQAVAAQRATAGSSSLDVRVDSGSGLTASQAGRLAALPGVAEAVPLYVKRVVASPVEHGFDGLSVTLVGLSHGGAALRPVHVVAGRLPRPGSLTEVAIDSALAQAITAAPGTSLRLGDSIQLITSTGPDRYRVVGFTSGTAGGPAFTRSAVFVDDAAMTGTFSLGLRTPLVALRLTPGETSSAVAAEVHRALGGAVATADPAAGSSQPLADLRPLLALVTLLATVLGAAVTANSAALTVLERRREIGLLRAAGASATQVFGLFAIETVGLVLCSIPIGIGAGLGLGTLLDHAFSPPDLPPPPLAPGAGQIAAAAAAGCGAALLGGLLPALSAARLPVLTALRPHPGRPRSRSIRNALAATAAVLVVAALGCFLAGGAAVAAGVACFLGGVATAMPVLAAPLAKRLAALLSPLAPASVAAARNLSRHRSRTSITAAGLAVSVAVATTLSVLSAGALTASDGWVNGLFPGDTVLTSAVTQRDSVALAVARDRDVRTATELRIFSEPVGGVLVGIAATDPAAFAASGSLGVLAPGRDVALRELASLPAVLVPESLAAETGWRTGTTLVAQAGGGAVRLTVAGVVAHSFPAGDGSEALLMDADQARTAFGITADGFDDLLLSTDGSGGNIAALAARYGLQAVPVSAVADAARAAVAHSIGLLVALAAIAVIIAVMAAVNTLVVNVREGTREIALLRAVGLGERHALRLVLGESGLLALSAAVVGVAAGCVVALPVLAATDAPGFTPGFAFPVEAGLALAAGVVLSAVVATLIPARRAVTTSVLTALHQE